MEQILCLADASQEEYAALLSEMVDMGILSVPQEGRYRLRRHSFLNIIGSDLDQLDADIRQDNKEAAVCR